MKTALITGIAGFVGHHVAEYLLTHTDWNVVGIDSFRHKGDSLRLVKIKNNPRVKIVTHDLTTPFSDRLISHIGHVDYILHIASDSHVDRSITDPVPFCKNNVMLTLETLEYARKINPEKILIMSTDEVFGAAHDGQLHVEWDAHRPSNVYAASKAAQENISFAYWRCYGLPIIRTNTMNIFGNRQDKEKFVPMCISKIQKGETVTIHGTSEKVGARMYLNAINLADAWLFLLKNHEPTMYSDDVEGLQQFDAFNIAGTEEVDNLTLAKKIAEFVGKPLIYEFLDFHKSRPGHDRFYRLDSTKIKSLGWEAPTPLWDSLRQTVDWTLEHPEWMI